MLSDDQIARIARSVLEAPVTDGVAPAWSLAVGIARAIEAEVRKQDDVLIRQMHDAMSNLTTLCLSGGSPLFTAEFDRLIEAATAARARLGEKT